MHKAKKHFKFVRVLKIFAVFVFHYSKRKPECSYSVLSLPSLLSPSLANHWANKSCSEWGRCCRGFYSNCIRNCSELFRMVWNCLSLSTFCEILMEIIVYALNKPAERRHQSHQTDRQTDNWQNSPVWRTMVSRLDGLAKPTSEKKGRLACWQQYNGT